MKTILVILGTEVLLFFGAVLFHLGLGGDRYRHREAFIAESVIGTLSPIPDAEARPLFLSIHRHLAAGMTPAQSVRRAQIEAVAGGVLPSWPSIAVITRCIHSA